jgi:hypothetical protein
MLISFYVHLLPVHDTAPASARTTTIWQMNTTDQRALWNANQTQRNATALASSIAPTQTQRVLTFNARTLITASVYLLMGCSYGLDGHGNMVNLTDRNGAVQNS